MPGFGYNPSCQGPEERDLIVAKRKWMYPGLVETPKPATVSWFATGVSLPYILWRRLEASILGVEYRRRAKWRPRRGHYWRSQEPHRRWIRYCFTPRTLLERPYYHNRNIGTTLWYCLCLFFWALANTVLNVLYFTACFALIFWIIHRHRDVLEDPETLTLQRQESIEMLGELPERYRDFRLVEERRRLRFASAHEDGRHLWPDV